jgi:hypothetical protein
MKRVLLLATLLGWSPLADAAGTKLVEGQVYRHAIEFEYNMKAPLPEGDWVFVGLDKGNASSSGKTINDLYLVNLDAKDGNKLVSIHFVESFSTISGASAGWNRASACDRTDVVHVVAVSNFVGGEQDCWLINHIVNVNFGSAADNRGKKLYQYLVAKGASLPSTVLDIHHHVANRNNLMVVRYAFDPAVAGIKPVPETTWALSEWHKSLIGKDPEKVAFVERMKAIGTQQHALVKAGFAGKLPAPPPPAAAPPVAQAPAAPAAVAMQAPVPAASAPVVTATAPQGPADERTLDQALAAYDGKDYVTALALFRPFASEGRAMAQLRLGHLYFNGWGTPVNLEEAALWYAKASDQNYPGAAAALTELRKKQPQPAKPGEMGSTYGGLLDCPNGVVNAANPTRECR